jgi:hypothetical protein
MYDGIRPCHVYTAGMLLIALTTCGMRASANRDVVSPSDYYRWSVGVPGGDWRRLSRNPEESRKGWRKNQEEPIQYHTFRYLFKTWGKKWPRAKQWNLGFLGVNTESNPVLVKLLKRLRAEKYPVSIGYSVDNEETLSFYLHDLRWVSQKRVLIRAQVSHQPVYDPKHPSGRSPIGDHYYGNILLVHRSGRWQVIGVQGRWEQPE